MAYATSLSALDGLIAAVAAGKVGSAASNGVCGVRAQPSAQASAQSAKPATGKGATAAGAGPAPKAEGPPKEKKEKAPKEKAPKAAKAPSTPAADRIIDVSWLDLRVGKILEAERHPESEKLYVEKIDVGEAEPRTILSGLAQHIPLDDVKGARVVVVCNLPARPLAGIPSHGMVLCASEVDAQGNKAKTEFVIPPDAAKVGERISFAEFPGEPEDEKKIKKKKVWEACAPDLATNAQGIACYKGAQWTTSAGACTAATVKGGPIS